ncbi:DEAD/DEAH box helicase family protein, partial [Staphylococcus hominis]|uniref:hypothetical protein n=1 Tax=Staphylococcus hominis TaxID=1290 RepID=UPI001C92E0C4
QIKQKIDHNPQPTFLLHPLTRSPKTQVYLQAIQELLKKHQQAMMLLPQIPLTPQILLPFKPPFRHDLPLLHSALSNR